jgi:hypothetical protein
MLRSGLQRKIPIAGIAKLNIVIIDGASRVEVASSLESKEFE